MSGRFEQIGKLRDVSGHLRLVFGSEADDPMPFVLTLMPRYVALATGKTPPVTFNEIEKYAYDHAGDLRTMASQEKDRGRLTLILG
jgi:hypothetical protein